MAIPSLFLFLSTKALDAPHKRPRLLVSPRFVVDMPEVPRETTGTDERKVRALTEKTIINLEASSISRKHQLSSEGVSIFYDDLYHLDEFLPPYSDIGTFW